MDQTLDEIIAGRATKPSSGGVDKRSRDGTQSSSSRKRRGAQNSRNSRGSGNGRGSGDLLPRRKEGNTVLIKNLSREIEEADLRQLFREVGPVSGVNVEEDNAGVRSGRAWVAYEFASDARVAVSRYDGRRAAGQIITVIQVDKMGSHRPASHLDNRIRLADAPSSDGARSRGRDRGRDRSGSAKKKSAKNPPKVAKSSEELDAELDAYMRDDTDANSVTGLAEPAPSASASNGGFSADPVIPAPAPAPTAADDIMIE